MGPRFLFQGELNFMYTTRGSSTFVHLIYLLTYLLTRTSKYKRLYVYNHIKWFFFLNLTFR
jgi:hypothetical protein